MVATVNSVMSIPLSAVGAHQTSIEVVLSCADEVIVDFSAAGVPPDAKIVRVYYTVNAEGKERLLWPMQPLDTKPGRLWIPGRQIIYPRGLTLEPGGEATKLWILVAWLPPGDPDVEVTQLVEAFDAFAGSDTDSGTYTRFVVPGNVAVEIAVGRVIANWLGQTANQADVRRFLNDGATYSYQLNILMPAMAGAIGAPRLPDDIRGWLNRLRKLRNEIAHSGSFRAPLTRLEAAECLSAAIFGVAYARDVQLLLSGEIDRP